MKVPNPKKLPSGSWFIQLRLGGESIPVTEATEDLCVKRATAIKAQFLADAAGVKRFRKDPSAITIGQAMDKYTDERAPSLSPLTVKTYRDYRRLRFPALTCRVFEELTTEEWISGFNAEVERLAASTLRRSWTFLCSVTRAELGKDPPEMRLPQVVKREKAFLDPDQILVFVKAVHNTSCEIPALLALSSMRRSEILALRWENVDLVKRLIRVQGAAVYNEFGVLVQKKENKNAASNRVIPILMPELEEALRKAQKPSGLVVEQNGDAIYHGINSVCRRAGLPEVGVHGLRHSFASLAYHLGISEKITMEIGGWSNYSTMRNIYTHVARQDVMASAAKLAGFFLPGTGGENANE